VTKQVDVVRCLRIVPFAEGRVGSNPTPRANLVLVTFYL